MRTISSSYKYLKYYAWLLGPTSTMPRSLCTGSRSKSHPGQARWGSSRLALCLPAGCLLIPAWQSSFRPDSLHCDQPFMPRPDSISLCGILLRTDWQYPLTGYLRLPHDSLLFPVSVNRLWSSPQKSNIAQHPKCRLISLLQYPRHTQADHPMRFRLLLIIRQKPHFHHGASPDIAKHAPNFYPPTLSV